MKISLKFSLLRMIACLALFAAATALPVFGSSLYLASGQYYSSIIVVDTSTGTVSNEWIQQYRYGVSPCCGEIPIAVDSTVRTIGSYAGLPGAQYTLGGTWTGTSYTNPGTGSYNYDSTTDGAHNYLVDFYSGSVYQTGTDYTGPAFLFNAGGSYRPGISYQGSNNSLWISESEGTTVANYTMSGVLLSSFSTGHYYNYALAFDPTDGTLWLNNGAYCCFSINLEHYTTGGALLGTISIARSDYTQIFSGEFSQSAAPVPEPGTLLLLATGLLGAGRFVRRKIAS